MIKQDVLPQDAVGARDHVMPPEQVEVLDPIMLPKSGVKSPVMPGEDGVRHPVMPRAGTVRNPVMPSEEL